MQYVEKTEEGFEATGRVIGHHVRRLDNRINYHLSAVKYKNHIDAVSVLKELDDDGDNNNYTDNPVSSESEVEKPEGGDVVLPEPDFIYDYSSELPEITEFRERLADFKTRWALNNDN